MSSIALARAYRHSFETRPNITLAIAGGALNALGDAVAQVAQKYSSNDENRIISRSYDFSRTLRFFCFGVGMSPLLGRWNKFLEFRFPLRPANDKGRVSLSALTKRVSADQLLMAPVGLSAFLVSMGIMEGRDRAQISAKFRDLYGPALIANWSVWPLAQFVNFRFMPLPYRVPFQQSCGVFWTLYLSIINSKESMYQDNDCSAEKV